VAKLLNEVMYTDEAVLQLDAADFDDYNEICCVVRHGECWSGSMDWSEVTRVVTLSYDSANDVLIEMGLPWHRGTNYEWEPGLRGYTRGEHALRVLSIVDQWAGEGS
jgi:hypothetical protein